MKRVFFSVLKKIIYLFAWLIIILAFICSILNILSPLANQYRQTIEMQMSQQLPFKVNIGKLSLRWGWYKPVVDLNDVKLVTKEGEVRILQMNTVRLSCSVWQSILAHAVVVLLKAHDIQLSWRKAFTQEIYFSTLSAKIQLIKATPNHYFFRVLRAVATNPELSIRIQGEIIHTGQKMPAIAMETEFDLSNASHLVHYLPLKQFHPDLVDWLEHAFLSGRISSGKIVLRGLLNDFPFTPQNGVFFVTGVLQHCNLAFASHWPILSDTTAHIRLERSSMQAIIDEAKLDDIVVKKGVIRIPDFSHQTLSQLHVDLPALSMDAMRAIHFIKSVPVLNQIFDQSLSGLQLTGPLNLDLGVVVPLKTPQNTTVNGALSLARVTMALPTWHLPLITDLHGKINFTRNTVQAEAINGLCLDRPISLSIKSVGFDHDRIKNTVLSLTHVLNSAAFIGWSGWSALEPFMQGESAVQIMIVLPSQANNRVTSLPVTVNIQSALKGLTLFLPGQYAKTASLSRLLKLKLTARSGQVLGLQAEYGHLQMSLKRMTPQGDWKMHLSDPQLLGDIFIPHVLSNEAPMKIEFKRLIVQPNHMMAQYRSSSSASTKPWNRFLPVMFDAQQMTYNAIDLGQVHAHLLPDRNGVNIVSLRFMKPPLMQCSAQGHITQMLKNHTFAVNLKGELFSKEISHFLQYLGVNMQNILLSTGKITFSLDAENIFTRPFTESMHVLAVLSLDKGRILDMDSSSAELGLARILTVLSVQTIPRRLSLDFSDLWQKGYSFDFIRGQLEYTRGNLYTNHLEIEGPVAIMHLHGRIGLIAKNYDLILGITPHMTASLPIAATLITGQPVVGLATWMVSQVVHSQLSKVTTHYYTITGPWAHPHWQVLHL